MNINMHTNNTKRRSCGKKQNTLRQEIQCPLLLGGVEKGTKVTRHKNNQTLKKVILMKIGQHGRLICIQTTLRCGLLLTNKIHLGKKYIVHFHLGEWRRARRLVKTRTIHHCTPFHLHFTLFTSFSYCWDLHLLFSLVKA